MKKLQYFLLIFIIFLTPKVFAAEYNMNSKTSATLNGTKNRYLGNEIYNTGLPNQYTFGTRYSGKLSTIDAYFDYPFEANTTYTLTYNMNTEDFRNNFGGKYWWDCSDTMNATNQHLGTFTYVSYKKVKFSFTPSENTTCIRVLLTSTNISSVAITGVSNWRLDSITLYDPDYQSGGGSGQGSTSPTPTPTSDYSSIINNQNDNTQDIINNQNDNTSDIIENNNENTEKIVDAIENKCSNLINHKVPSLLSGVSQENLTISDNSITFKGNDNSTASNYVAYYLDVNQSTDYHLSVANNSNLIIVFNPSYNTIARLQSGQNSVTFNTLFNDRIYVLFYSRGQNNTTYSDIMLSIDNKPYCAFGSSSNRLDETTNAINQQNEYLMDNSDPNISDNEFLNTFNSVGFSDPLNYLLTLPTQLINKIVSLSDSCSPVELGSLYGTMLTLPCINIENIIGSSVWNIIDVIFSVSLLVVILKNLYDTFSNLLTMGAEKEAKEKFSMPTPMDFLSMILGGDR